MFDYVDLAPGQHIGPGLGVWGPGVCIVVVSGSVDLIQEGRRLAVIGPGQFFLRPAARSAGVDLVASVSTRVVMMMPERANELLVDEP